MRDLAETWEELGAEAMRKAALCEPAKFVAICASLIPKDVQLTLQTRLPGNLSPEEYDTLIGVLSAVREALPEADRRNPADAMQFVLDAIRSHGAKPVENCSPVANLLPSNALQGPTDED
jgi:hypothetical protein